MTKEEATKICGYVGCENSNGTINYDAVLPLKRDFPEFNWRVILDRSGEYSRGAITIDDNDPREHFIPIGGRCIHCGKTAAELGVAEALYDD